MRIGMGYDVHRLTTDRKLILGGVEIPYERGLLGLCRRLDVYLRHFDMKRVGDILPHRVDMRAHLRCLRDNRRVNIFNQEKMFFQQPAHMLQKLHGRNPFIGRVRIRKMSLLSIIFYGKVMNRLVEKKR